jgi:hypothetical protein
MSPESTVALARRQITSPFQKVTIGLSKFFQNKASQSEGAAIQDFLLDPKKIEEVAKLYNQLNLTDDTEKVKSLAMKVVKYTTGEVARRGSYAAYLGAISDFGSDNQPIPPQPQENMQFNFAPQQ